MLIYRTTSIIGEPFVDALLVVLVRAGEHSELITFLEIAHADDARGVLVGLCGGGFGEFIDDVLGGGVSLA